jgi:hypothetical protein
MKPAPLLLCWFLGGFLALPLAAADFYVSPTGDDGNPGSLASPWRTIQHAAETVPAGSTVFLRGGIYSEKVEIYVSGNAIGGPITFKAYPGEEPILDGTGLPFDPVNSNALITIYDQSYLRIEGLTLRNLKTATRDLVPIGILVENESHHIELVDNVIHDIETNYNGLDGGDAHGIAVFGSAATPISEVLITGNELYDLKLGSSEALVLNGNVNDFEVSGNVVRDCNNIGIDFIGYEGTGPTPAVDRARDGICRNNLVFHIDSAFNPAYNGNFTSGGGDTSAGGIYVDGGARILIEGNVVHHCNIGIELASEHAGRTTEEITLRDNLLYHNTIGGLFLGGYDTQRGSTQDCVITNNTLFENDTNQDGNGEIYLQFDVRNCTFRNNLLKSNGQGLQIGNPYTQNSGNLVDYQLFFAPGGAQEWQWKNVFYTTLAGYRTGSGNDAASLLSNPLFADAAKHDFRLASGSPARNAADPAFVTAVGETDLHGATRVNEGRVDHGAIEYRAAAPDADLAIAGDAPAFGTVVWRRDGAVVRTFLLSNTGSESFRPVRFALEGAGASAFHLERSFARLAPGQSRIVRVSFEPDAVGDYAAELVIQGAHADGSELRWSLSGEAIAPNQLPDERAGLSPANLIGDDLYDANGLGQTVSLTLKRRQASTWFRAENDGALDDDLQLSATRGDRFLKVTFFRTDAAGRRNVSAALFAGTDLVPLASGAGQTDECRLAKSKRAEGKRLRRSYGVTALSTTAPELADRAVLRVVAK